MSEGLEILSDFDGAMVGAIRIDGRVVSIDLLYDQPAKADWLERDYSLPFCFRYQEFPT